MTRLVNPAGLKRQSYYSHAVIRRGTPVFLTGQVAWDADGRVVGPGDAAAQCRQVWGNIRLCLADMGVGVEHIVKLVTYALDRDMIPAIHAARSEVFGNGPYPASTFVVVAGLAEPDLLLEIDVIAMVPDDVGSRHVVDRS